MLLFSLTIYVHSSQNVRRQTCKTHLPAAIFPRLKPDFSNSEDSALEKSKMAKTQVKRDREDEVKKGRRRRVEQG
jgi:hypothetical protein